MLDTEAKARGREARAGCARRRRPPAAPHRPAPSRRQRWRRGMPAAAKLVAENGLDRRAVTGTRPRRPHHQGRRDRAPREGGAPRAAAPAAAQPRRVRRCRRSKAPVDRRELADRPEQRVPMSRLRQRVAERLLQSQSTAAILTTFNEVNMQPVMELRNKLPGAFEKEHGVKLGLHVVLREGGGARAARSSRW